MRQPQAPEWLLTYHQLRRQRLLRALSRVVAVGLLLGAAGLLVLEEAARDIRWLVASGALAVALMFVAMDIWAWSYVACIGRALALGAGAAKPVEGEDSVQKRYERLVWFASRAWIRRWSMVAACMLFAAAIGACAYLLIAGTHEMVAVGTGFAFMFAAAQGMTVALLQDWASAVVGRLEELAPKSAP